MKLPRQGRSWLDLVIELVDVHGNTITGATVEASFDASLTWVAADTSDAGYRWLLDGPDYDPAAAGMPAAPDGVVPTVIAADTEYVVRAVAGPEVVVGRGKITLDG